MRPLITLVAGLVWLSGTGGALAQVCTLLPVLPGTLALSADGLRLGSAEGLATPAGFSVASIGSNTVTISAPSRISSPAGYVPTGELLETAYFGAGLLGAVNQGYTSTQTSFDVGTLAATVVTLNNRVTNPAGFAAGNYVLRTVVTCS